MTMRHPSIAEPQKPSVLVWCLLIVVIIEGATLASVGWLLFHRQAQRDVQFCAVLATVPRSAKTNMVRRELSCPDFLHPSPALTSTVTQPSVSRPTPTPVRQPPASPHRSPKPGPHPTMQPAPRPTVTVTRTSKPRPTPTPSPSPSCSLTHPLLCLPL